MVYKPPKVIIDMQKCSLCGACADICTGGAIETTDTAVYYDKNSCIICESCHDFYQDLECPTNAFEIKEEA